MLVATVVVRVHSGHTTSRSARNDEKCRYLNRTSERMRGAFALVSEALAQDPGLKSDRLAELDA